MFETKYATEAEVPGEVKHLFKSDGNGGMILIPSHEIKTTADTTTLQEALRKERSDHSLIKSEVAKLGRPVDEVLVDLDKIGEYKMAAEGNMDEAKIEEIVTTRLKSATAPLERQITTLTTDKDALAGQVTAFETQNVTRTITDDIRKAATESKMHSGAVDDAIMLGLNNMTLNEAGQVVTKDNVGVTAGVPADVWLTEMQPNRSHWWPENKGAGLKGGGTGTGGATNPFSGKDWNMTAQGAMVQADPAKAQAMAQAAGTTVGGARPAE